MTDHSSITLLQLSPGISTPLSDDISHFSDFKLREFSATVGIHYELETMWQVRACERAFVNNANQNPVLC
jgi:hypothetical protein